MKNRALPVVVFAFVLVTLLSCGGAPRDTGTRPDDGSVLPFPGPHGSRGVHGLGDVDVGLDTSSPVADDYFDKAPFAFNGHLGRLYFTHLPEGS